MAFFSIIIPVYNRIDEVRDLLESLASQSDKDFETILVEDGSTERCEAVALEYATTANAKYFYKENEGRSIARNYGMERAQGDYFLFFDSDCVIPPQYIATLKSRLVEHPSDCFGGPDAAHDSFSTVQKAINYSMTSFLTTGGIRGGKVQLEKFVPRTFNMGFRREVWEKVGGFREMFSEDIDMSTLRLFCRQVYVFGMSRITLKLLYPDSLKAVHMLPAAFVLGVVVMTILALTLSWWWIMPLVAYLVAIFICSLATTKSLTISVLSILTGIIQLGGYGCGFLKAFFIKILLRRGRNIDEEIAIRKGK